MSDESRHPVVQAMIDVVEEILAPEKLAARRALQPAQPAKKVQLVLDPETAFLLQLIQMGIDPSDLFPEINKPDDKKNGG